jgi:hypothetical protein
MLGMPPRRCDETQIGKLTVEAQESLPKRTSGTGEVIFEIECSTKTVKRFGHNLSIGRQRYPLSVGAGRGLGKENDRCDPDRRSVQF